MRLLRSGVGVPVGPGVVCTSLQLGPQGSGCVFGFKLQPQVTL